MKISATRIPEVLLIEPDVIGDSRGFFMESWHKQKYAELGLAVDFVQDNHSRSAQGVLRGLHYQAPPFEEARTLRCIAGAAFVVIVDIRPESRTFRRYEPVVLSAENRRSLYVPPRFALGFQTLMDHTEILYLMSEIYDPAHARGLRWNDPAFAIDWPDDQRTILDRDADYPDLAAGQVAELELELA